MSGKFPSLETEQKYIHVPVQCMWSQQLFASINKKNIYLQYSLSWYRLYGKLVYNGKNYLLTENSNPHAKFEYKYIVSFWFADMQYNGSAVAQW